MAPFKLLRAAPLLLLSTLGLGVCGLLACGGTDNSAETEGNALSRQGAPAPSPPDETNWPNVQAASSGYGGYGGYGTSGYGGYVPDYNGY